MIEIVSNQGVIDLTPMLGATPTAVDLEAEVALAAAARDGAVAAKADAELAKGDAQAAQAAAELARDEATEISGIDTLDEGNAALIGNPASLTAQRLKEQMGAEAARDGSPLQVELADGRAPLLPRTRPAIQRVFLPCRDMLGSVQVIGHDPVDGITFFTGGAATIYLSNNAGTSRGNDKVAPPGTAANTARSMVRHKGHVYAAVIDATSAKVQVYRAAPITNINSGGGTFAWSAPLLVTNADTWITQQLASDGTYIYLAEYGDPVGGPKIYRSASGDQGTWETVYHSTALRHFHGIYADPYHPGHLYVTGGDNAGLSPTLRSNDYGITWAPIVSDNFRQAVAVSFTEEYVWFSSDGTNGALYLYDRDTGAWSDGAANLPRLTPVPGGAAGAEFYRIGYNGVVDPETGIYYVVMGNSSAGGTRAGLFYLSHPGGRFELLEVFTEQIDGAMFLAGPRLFVHKKYRERITLA